VNTAAEALEVRTSTNRIGYSAEYDLLIQHRLIVDIHRALAPAGAHHGTGREGFARQIVTDRDGTVMVPLQLHHGDPTARWDPNPVASSMVSRCTKTNHELEGPVAWLGYADEATGLYSGLDDDQLDELAQLAAEAMTTYRRWAS
jgi:hypothetical protein